MTSKPLGIRPDYLKFRTQSNPYEVLEAVRPAFDTLGPCLSLGKAGRGHDGWETCHPLMVSGIEVAQLDHGGASQKGWLRFHMRGEGCEWVQFWDPMAKLVDVLKDAELRRVDLAMTTFDGEASHDAVIEAHGMGLFQSDRGGVSPHYRVIGGSDPRAGRTIYVGNRAGAKMARCYEKGWEMLKDTPASTRDGCTALSFNGSPSRHPASIYRVEVEFKAVDGYVIPWPMLADPDTFFAGAYPYCADLCRNSRPAFVPRLPDWRPLTTLARALDNCRTAYGSHLAAALEFYNGDAAAVLALLTENRAPSRMLVDAGLLTLGPPDAH